MSYIVNGQLISEEMINAQYPRLRRNGSWRNNSGTSDWARGLRAAAESAAIDNILIAQVAEQDSRPLDDIEVAAEARRQKAQWGAHRALGEDQLRAWTEFQLRTQRIKREIADGAMAVTRDEVESHFSAIENRIRQDIQRALMLAHQADAYRKAISELRSHADIRLVAPDSDPQNLVSSYDKWSPCDTLENLAIGLNTDKGTAHSYLPYYDTLFSNYRAYLKAGQLVRLMEIGVQTGGSIHLWRRYFGPKLALHCLDTVIPCDLPQGTSFHLGNACDDSFVRSSISPLSFDIIIDDASHELDQQICAFNLFWPLLKSGGLFIIEDLQSLDFVQLIAPATSSKFEVVD